MTGSAYLVSGRGIDLRGDVWHNFVERWVEVDVDRGTVVGVGGVVVTTLGSGVIGTTLGSGVVLITLGNETGGGIDVLGR